MKKKNDPLALAVDCFFDACGGKCFVCTHKAQCSHQLNGTVVAGQRRAVFAVACAACDFLLTWIAEVDVHQLAFANDVIADHAGAVQWYRDTLDQDVPGVLWHEDMQAEWHLGGDSVRIAG